MAMATNDAAAQARECIAQSESLIAELKESFENSDAFYESMGLDPEVMGALRNAPASASMQAEMDRIKEQIREETLRQMQDFRARAELASNPSKSPPRRRRVMI